MIKDFIARISLLDKHFHSEKRSLGVTNEITVGLKSRAESEDLKDDKGRMYSKKTRTSTWIGIIEEGQVRNDFVLLSPEWSSIPVLLLRTMLYKKRKLIAREIFKTTGTSEGTVHEVFRVPWSQKNLDSMDPPFTVSYPKPGSREVQQRITLKTNFRLALPFSLQIFSYFFASVITVIF